MAIYEYQGHVGLDAISKAVGIPAATIAYRVRIQGLTLDQALQNKKHAIVNKQARRKRGKYQPREEKKNYVGVKYSDLMSPSWRLALGIGKDLGAEQCQ
ncbi:hypothetical protein [Vibrio furnissii]|uniref:hypothetical protein n=1 Tax=Vibrio furnissii TaxID=29494 RepID=UPI001EEC334B|nr:hypothetical protein [Vibrio furnissii]